MMANEKKCIPCDLRDKVWEELERIDKLPADHPEHGNFIIAARNLEANEFCSSHQEEWNRSKGDYDGHQRPWEFISGYACSSNY